MKIERIYYQDLKRMLVAGHHFKGYAAPNRIPSRKVHEHGYRIDALDLRQFERQRYLALTAVEFNPDAGNRLFYWQIVED